MIFCCEKIPNDRDLQGLLLAFEQEKQQCEQATNNKRTMKSRKAKKNFESLTQFAQHLSGGILRKNLFSTKFYLQTP